LQTTNRLIGCELLRTKLRRRLSTLLLNLHSL
jgi:hypothetical protein